MFSVSFKVDLEGFDEMKRTLALAGTRAEHNVALQIRKDTSPFVPARTKTLDNTAQVIGNTILYVGPGVRMLYNGLLMIDPETGSSYAKYGHTKVVTDKALVFNRAVNPLAQAHWFEASKAQNLDKWLRVAQKAVSRFG